ncbi:MAG: hypothetical protein ABIL09_16935 [Gemmatimonadota bacterium]
MPDRLRVAAIITIYHPKSHADVIVTKLLKGMSTDDGFLPPEVDVVSIYLDHVLENDIGVGLAREFGVPIYPSIRRALYCGTGKELGVDAVLLVGEHGDYPWNERGRHCYPRRYFFEQIAGVFGECGRSVPVFNDKHFSYDFADARWMWNRAAEMKIPLMAGSSLPLCWRQPWVEYDKGVDLAEALSIGYGGIEAYGYHALETLQCMVERRAGGEAGVVSVQCLEGDEVWKSRDRGQWSGELAEAACAAIRDKPAGRMEDLCKEPAVFLIERADGFRSATLMLNGYVHDFAYAGRLASAPQHGAIALDSIPSVHGVEFYLQNEGPFAHFSYLCRNVQRFFQTGVAPYPPARTLLTTGITDAMMISRYEGHRVVPTPYLDLAYESYDAPPFRPEKERPQGACVDPSSPDRI